MNKYIGHPSQLYGVEEKRLVGGKGDGMRVLDVRNGRGLACTVSVDRCADLSQVYLGGINLAYISPCGMVSPKYYDNKGAGFLKSFTAGFLTTCGLTAVGSPCTDAGEDLPLHGTISNAPAENISWTIEDEFIKIKAVIRDASLFSHQLTLTREYICSLTENKIDITDTVENIGCHVAPFMILYHCNMGYPLLNEDTVLDIPSNNVTPRDDHAKEGLDNWNKITPPSDNFVEQCYYHTFSDNPTVKMYNSKANIGIKMSFDKNELDCFTQWKMLGSNEYVMGLEPANCYPDGRAYARENGTLKFLQPGEKKTIHLHFDFYNPNK